MARIVSDHLAKELGQPVVIENRGGGGGSVGSNLVAGAEPDGYTLLFATAGSHSVNPVLRDVGYDPLADFDPVSVAVISSVLIVVHPSVEAQTLEELIALTPGGAPLHYASGGDRKSVVQGKIVSVRVALGGWRIFKKKIKPNKS